MAWRKNQPKECHFKVVIFAAEYAVTNWSLIIWKFIEKERELMDKFTVEEINLMCVFKGQDRTGMIADIQNVIPHIQDSDMVELNLGVTVKLPPVWQKSADCSYQAF